MPQTNRLCCLIWAACLVAPLAASAQEAKLPINLRVPVGEKDCANAMVAYALPAGLAAESLRLIETTAGKETPVAVQWDAASGKLWWVAAGVTPAKATRSFRLEKGVAPETQPIVMADSAKLVEAHFQNRQLLHYNKAHVEPGDGIDPNSSNEPAAADHSRKSFSWLAPFSVRTSSGPRLIGLIVIGSPPAVAVVSHDWCRRSRSHTAR